MLKELPYEELSFEERKKFAEEVVADTRDIHDLLGPPKKRRKSLKAPSEKLVSYASFSLEDEK